MFPVTMFGKNFPIPYTRYSVKKTAKDFPLVLIDNFIVGLCKELGVYVDCQFD